MDLVRTETASMQQPMHWALTHTHGEAGVGGLASATIASCMMPLILACIIAA